jgi:hypothetical protein
MYRLAPSLLQPALPHQYNSRDAQLTSATIANEEEQSTSTIPQKKITIIDFRSVLQPWKF